jgi:hypothetical protein
VTPVVSAWSSVTMKLPLPPSEAQLEDRFSAQLPDPGTVNRRVVSAPLPLKRARTPGRPGPDAAGVDGVADGVAVGEMAADQTAAGEVAAAADGVRARTLVPISMPATTPMTATLTTSSAYGHRSLRAACWNRAW